MTVCFFEESCGNSCPAWVWSGRPDLNRGPSAPKLRAVHFFEQRENAGRVRKPVFRLRFPRVAHFGWFRLVRVCSC